MTSPAGGTAYDLKTDTADSSPLEPPAWMKRLEPFISLPSLSLAAAVALAVNLPVSQVHHLLVDATEGESALLCVQHLPHPPCGGDDDSEDHGRRCIDGGWDVIALPPSAVAQWTDPEPSYATNRWRVAAGGFLLHRFSATSLLDIDDDYVEEDDPVVGALVGLWWKIESARGLDPESAWTLLSLHPTAGLTDLAETVGIPRRSR